MRVSAQGASPNTGAAERKAGFSARHQTYGHGTSGNGSTAEPSSM
jgi:hypothetical protein